MPSPRTEADGAGTDPAPSELDVVIIGAGFAGLAMGRQLKQAGIESFRILDRADGVGGVWRANRYPGAACDVPSHLYSFSFFLNPDWSRKFSPQSEILAYLERAADAFDLRSHLAFNTAVEALRFDAAAGRWRVDLAGGETIEARAVISAVGQLAEPFTPALEGADQFAGETVHSADWNDAANYAGKRVAVIGAAASAIQLLPRIAHHAREVTVFQRTPNWIVDKPDRAFLGLEKAAFRAAPWWGRLYRRASFLIHEGRYSAFVKNSLASRFTRWRLLRRLKREVFDPELRAKLTPDYPPGCKRILLSNDFFEILQRRHVHLVADRPVRLERDAVITEQGERHRADAIIFATGFKASEFLAGIDVTGREGRILRDVWGASPRAYRGVAVSGFPNLFMLYGPNTNLGHNSIIFMLERQSEYVRTQIERLLKSGVRAMEVDQAAQDRFNAQLQARLADTVWAAHCASWYKSPDGVITNNWSGLATAFAMTLRRPDDDAWIVYT